MEEERAGRCPKKLWSPDKWEGGTSRGDWRTNVAAYAGIPLVLTINFTKLDAIHDKLNVNSYSLAETRFASPQSRVYCYTGQHQYTELFEPFYGLLFLCTFYPIYEIHHSNFMLHRSNS